MEFSRLRELDMGFELWRLMLALVVDEGTAPDTLPAIAAVMVPVVTLRVLVEEDDR